MARERKHANLGRGLSALLGEEDDADRTVTQSSGGAPYTLPIEFLQPGRYQPRKSMDEEEIKDLADSIKGKGILQPILVRPRQDAADRYEIIAGERRWRAAQMAQLHEVPVIVRDMDDQQALEIALVENLQRENLSPLDEAEGFRVLMDEFSHTQEGLAKSLGKSRSHVTNTLRLLNLPDAVKEMMRTNQISAGHGRALLAADDPVALAKKVVHRGLNVRQTEKLVKKGEPVRRGATGKAEKDADTLALERNMSMLLGLRVDIGHGPKGGCLAIYYQTLEQLDDVLRRITLGTRDGPHTAPHEDLSPIVDDSMVNDLGANDLAIQDLGDGGAEEEGREGGGLDEDYSLSDDDLGALANENETAEEARAGAGGLDEDYALSDDDLSALLEETPLEQAAPAGEDKNGATKKT